MAHDATDDNVDMMKGAVKEAIAVHHLMHLKTEMKGKKVEALSRTDIRNRRE